MKKMKRILSFLTICLLFLPCVVFATDSSCTVTGPTKESTNVYSLTYSWTAKSTDGSFASVAGNIVNGWLFMVITDPGSTPPQDNYDITITDAYSIDVMGGSMANRDTANAEMSIPILASGIYGTRFVNTALTLNISGNNVGSATGVVKLYFYTDQEASVR